VRNCSGACGSGRFGENCRSWQQSNCPR